MIWQGPPTVGDTITVSHMIFAPRGAIVQARPITDSATATMIGPPMVTRVGDSVRIAYTIAVWAPGHSVLTLPGALIVNSAGIVDTLPAAPVALDVASLLPNTAPKSIAPRAALPWLPRLDRSDLPFVILVPLALIIGGLLQWLARRQPRPQPLTIVRPPQTLLTDARLDAWLAAGETRLVLEQIDALVRDRPDFADWRSRADAVRFGVGDDTALAELAREGWGRWQRGSTA